MATLTAINSRLKNLSVVSGFDKLASQAITIATSVQALNSSSLGITLNENISGVQSLNTTINSAYAIGLLTKNLTGLQSQVVKDVSGSKTQLDAITGATVDNAFLDFVFASATAEGIKSAINTVATPSNQQLNTILTNVVPKQFSGQVSDLVTKNFTQFSSELTSAVSSFSGAFSDILGSATGNILQDIILQTDTGPLNIIQNLGISSAASGHFLNLLQTEGIAKAAISIAALTGKSITDIEIVLGSVPLSLSSQIQKRNVSASTTGVYDVSSKNNEWNGASTPDNYFDIIATQEHLMIELIKSSREITEVVFFGHEMTEDQILTSKEIHKSYIADGNDGIPFHYTILPNGNLQRGRALSREGTFSTTHNKYSIGVVIPHVKNSPATTKQGETVKLFLEAFYQVWPGGQVFDARLDTDNSSVPVGVNITNYVSLFKKINYGSAARSFSTQQLIAASQGNV